MKTAHTPTPYTLRTWGKTISIETASHDRQIAVVNPYDDHDNGIPDAQTRANAKFIVRAVNNHAALIEQCEILEKVILRQIRIYEKSGDDEGVRLQTFSLIRLQDVLAAARGEEGAG